MKGLAILRVMRPHQWVKNFFVFAPLLFSQRLLDTASSLRSFAAFGLFCFLSGAIYIFNDLQDIEKDRLHPHKKFRPLASGDLSEAWASKAWPFLMLATLSCATLLGWPFVATLATYGLLNIAYSLRLKHVPYLDVLIVASGFLLRVLAGAFALRVQISSWIVFCGFLLALYLALGKRRHEISAQKEKATDTRTVLGKYRAEQLDLALGIVASLTILAYCGYTLDPSTLRRFQTPDLIYTIPLIVFGIIRFLQLIQRGAQSESPTQELLRDPPILISVFLWVACVIYILYLRPPSPLSPFLP